MSEESLVDLYRPQVEDLTSLFYRTVREHGGRTNHQPSGDKIRWWLEQFGEAAVEQAFRRGIPAFLRKMPDRVIRTEKDALYLVNYLQVCIKGVKSGTEPAKYDEPITPNEGHNLIRQFGGKTYRA